MDKLALLDHANRDHAIFSPSSMARIVNCPPSVFLGLEIPDPPSSEKADEGTLAHQIAEVFLQAKLEGKPYPKVVDAKYNPEMVRCARAYAEFGYKIVKPYLHLPHYWAIEERLNADEDRGIWGTGDFTFIYRDTDNLKNVILMDYKYGTWTVDAKKNWQMSTYGYGAMSQYQGAGKMGTLSAYIYQPRSIKASEKVEKYNPKAWVIDFEQLEDEYISLINSSVDLVRAWIAQGFIPDEDLLKYQRPGKHCHFCKAKGICEAYKSKTSGPLLTLFKKVVNKIEPKYIKDITKESVQAAGLVSLEDISFIALNSSKIKAFVEAVDKIALDLGLQGYDLPGGKVVETNGRRNYISNTDLIIQTLKAKGIKKPVTYVPQVMTLTEVEKILGKNSIPELIAPATKKSYEFVADDDKRDPAELPKRGTMVLFNQFNKKKQSEK